MPTLPALALLLVRQELPGADVLKRLDRLFAGPSLAAFRAPYEAAKRDGAWSIVRSPAGLSVTFGAATKNGTREYSVEFGARGELSAISGPSGWFGNLPARDREEVSPQRIAAAARAVREITGEDREIEVGDAMVDENGERMAEFRAYRRVAGRPVMDSPQDLVMLGRRGEKLWQWGRDPEASRIDAERHGQDPTLPIARLREIARRRLLRGKIAFGFEFAQFLLETDRIEIALPEKSRSGGEMSRYRDLVERRVGIPIYHRQEYAPKEPKGDATIGITLDARDGTILAVSAGTGRMGSSGGPIPVPATFTVAGRTGILEPLPMRSATPPGRRVELPVGRNVFTARFEPGQGTLWISPGGREPYRAYRPEPRLCAALSAHLRREDASR